MFKKFQHLCFQVSPSSQLFNSATGTYAAEASTVCLESFLCSTSLPLASTKWTWSTFSSWCPLSPKQHRWLTYATSTIFCLKYLGECWESNLGQLGPEASVLTIVLCCHLSGKKGILWDSLAMSQINNLETHILLQSPGRHFGIGKLWWENFIEFLNLR